VFANQDILHSDRVGIAQFFGAKDLPGGIMLEISGRNKLKGKVVELQLGDIMALVTLQVGENLVDSVITRKSAEQLQLKVGDEVAALIKATEVMVLKQS
jgi:molybdopterin-binding protein